MPAHVIDQYRKDGGVVALCGARGRPGQWRRPPLFFWGYCTKCARVARRRGIKL
ncbi:hypothetical protein ABZ215_13450 [Amycolatopsis sp. NPDC006131]|uniref:hypothetical protein n=1 Tax=Amycolatopsis sp. NPDC006131 TaxID=3156731 RepID=UPI00339F190C